MNSLRTVSQKQDDELIESLTSNKYQYVFGLMTVGNPVFGGSSAVKVEDVFEHRGMDVFLKKEFVLAIVGGPHRRSYIQNLAHSGEPGNRVSFTSHADSSH